MGEGLGLTATSSSLVPMEGEPAPLSVRSGWETGTEQRGGTGGTRVVWGGSGVEWGGQLGKKQRGYL